MRTDKPEAELGLYDDQQQRAYTTWQAHRQLAETIHTTIRQLLDQSHLTLQDVEGIAIYQGPGSFTGLRIGMSVANALAASLHVPIVAKPGENWMAETLQQLVNGVNQQIVVPFYGADVHITQQKH